MTIEPSDTSRQALEAARDRDNATIYRIEAADAMRKNILNIILGYERAFAALNSDVGNSNAETCASIRKVIASLSTTLIINS